ncbi:MAG: hypothetical protein ABEK50_15715 [bacterium]
MVTERQKTLIQETVSRFDQLKSIDISGKEDPYCVISFTTTFAGETAYDLELSEASSGYETILLSSSETPIMRDRIDSINEEQIDSLIDHVIETIRELEGN